jgi:hypothetical protein
MTTKLLSIFLLVLVLGVVVTAKIDSLVNVYDDVLSAETATWLHEECQKLKNDDVVFVFPLEYPEQHTPIEQVLNQILHQLYPDTTGTQPLYYVEFWKRREWFHILAHADMDEGWGRQMQRKGENYQFKHPETGHVLYLQLGSRVQGPTVVWNVSQGVELSASESTTEMIAVPAVEGRLLRFQGDLLHAVPRPADMYWTHKQENAQEPPEFYQRSVLLFNTWRIDQGNIVDYDILNGTESSSPTTIPKTLCNPKEEWNQVPVVTYEPPASSWFLSTPTTSPFQVPLMGDAHRRGMDSVVAHLQAPEGCSEFLKEASQVTSMLVQPPKPWFSLMGVEF